MTRKEKLKVLADWQAAMQKADAMINPLIELAGLSPDGAFCDAVFLLQEAATDFAALAVGDHGHWLSWFALENDFGTKAKEAGFPSNLKPITTLAELLELIEVTA